MSRRQLFYSSLKEKHELLRRLESASSHDEIDTAILIVKDAILLHELHGAVNNLQDYVIKNSHSGAYHSLLAPIEKFYTNLTKRLTVAKRSSVVKRSNRR